MDQNGNEIVQLNRADGLAISAIKNLGVKQIIISTEKNPVVSIRANKLGIPCLQGIDNKKEKLLDYCKKNNFHLKDVAYVGNDINDQKAMEISGTTFCPADSHDIIRKISDYVLQSNGGQGIVRELLDLIIK